MAGKRLGRPSSAYERTCLGIAITVTAVWAIATLVQIVAPSHPVPVTVSATMGIVATGFFSGAYFWSRRSAQQRASAETKGDTE